MDTENIEVVNLDDIRPSNFEDVIEDNGWKDCCIICGRKLRPADKKMVHMLPNGDITEAECAFIEPCAELGWWYVGNTCYRKFRQAVHSVPVRQWREQNGY